MDYPCLLFSTLEGLYELNQKTVIYLVVANKNTK